ncbi:hypothetical protein DFH09DRAFT_1125599 [Mycena vulgaris]|nr:hypothetical protein DFH09DRAFT_1125599 [Mycena vulgaris]
MPLTGSEEDLPSQISGLQLTERSELQEQRDTHTYPVLTLPPEIVSEIFENFLPPYPRFPPLYGTLSPLFLCQICRQWRQIALSTPTLWRSIQIDDIQDNDRLELMKTWISRSGNCPLALSITGYSPMLHVLSQYLETAVLHCKRWEHIEIIMPFENLHVIQGEMPLLRQLTFGPSELPREGEHTALTLFDHAPQLKRAIITDCFLSPVLVLPWAQLTHLEGTCLYEHECIEILGHAINLTHCTLNVCTSADEDYIRLPVPLILPQLCHFILHITDTDVYLSKILDNVSLPALRSFHVPEPPLGIDPLGALAAFISQSHCSLEELCVQEASLTFAAYREALPSIGTIRLVPATDT